MSAEPEYKFKVLITGTKSVGKSSLIRRFVDDKFSESYVPTILSDFTTKEVRLEGTLIRLLLYELAGHEKYAAHQMRHFKMADHICVVSSFDIRESLERIPDLVKRSSNAWSYANDGPARVPVTAVVNKLDLVREHPDCDNIISRFRCVLERMVGSSVREILLTSAKTGDGVGCMFSSMAARLLWARTGSLNASTGAGT
jgi:small GTP-binding protein